MRAHLPDLVPLCVPDSAGNEIHMHTRVDSTLGHFTNGEVLGVVNYGDGFGTELVVLTTNNVLRNVSGPFLKVCSKE